MFYPCSSLSVRGHSALLGILCLGVLSALPVLAQTPAPSDEKPGRVEGTYYIGKTPGANVDMIIIRQGDGVDRTPIPWAKTDAAGNFVFENVAPGEYRVGHLQECVEKNGTFSRDYSRDCHSRGVFVASGETVKLQIGGTGRKIAGRMVAPAGVKTKLAWRGDSDRMFYTDQPRPRVPEGLSPEAAKKWWDDYSKTDEYRKSRMESLSILPIVEEDGTFSAVDVPPGSYFLMVDIPEEGVEDRSHPAAAVGHSFTVPPGEDGAVLELGEVPVTMKDSKDLPKK